MRRTIRISPWIVAAVVILATSAPSAYAGEESGVSVFVPDTLETSEMADGSTTEKSTAKGFAVASDPSSPMHLITQTCSGNWLVAPDGASRTGKGRCESIDPEGDLLSFWWKGNQDGGTWGIESGTGKWMGATGGGTWEAVAQWEDGRYANSWSGSWTGGPDTMEETDEGEPPVAESPLDPGGD